jgi:hypothetical protein
MTKHMVGTREDWLAARLDLLKAEKELTRRSDEVARHRARVAKVIGILGVGAGLFLIARALGLQGLA